MNKLFLIFLISILFTIPIGFSPAINFTEKHNITTPSASYTWNRIKAYQYNEATWFVTYQLGNSAYCNRYFVKTDEIFTNIGSSCIGSYGNPPSSYEYVDSDCSITNDLAGEERFSCIGHSSFHAPNVYYNSLTDWFMTNQSSNMLTFQISINGLNDIGTILTGTDDRSQLFLWRKIGESNTDPHYTQTYNLGSTMLGDGTVNFPTIYEDFTDIQSVMCNYQLHFILKRSPMVDLIYDYGLNYHNFQNVQPIDYNPDIYDYSVYVDEDTWSMYISVLDRDNQTINLQAWKCESDYTLSHIFTYDVLMTDIEPTTNYTANKYMDHPYFMKDRNSLYKLFYEWRDNTIQNVKVASEPYTCNLYGNWTGTTECVDNYRKYTRYVSPIGCDINTTMWQYEPSYCSITEFCTPEWVCLDSDTKTYHNSDCTYSSQIDCTGGTPYCLGGVCISGCTRGYACVDSVTQAFVDESCVQSEIVNCNSTGYGYCYDRRCYEELRPAFDDTASVLDILQTMTDGVKNMLKWISPPLLYILMAVAVTMLIMGIFSLIVSVAKKVGR